MYRFREARQGSTETLDQYYTRLRSLSARCEFVDAEFEILLQIVLCGSSTRLRKQALRDPKLTLKDVLVIGQQFGVANNRNHRDRDSLKQENNQSDDSALYAVRDTRNPAEKTYGKSICRNCGGEWPHKNGQCPAKGKECRKCLKLNHFARVCRSARQSQGRREAQGRDNANIRPLNTSDNNSQSAWWLRQLLLYCQQ